MHLTTDRTGGFSTELAPGFYDVAVFARSFSPRALKVRLRSGKAMFSDVKLVVDPLMCEEFCDDFGSTPVVVPTIPSPEPKQR
jgi:hypothetical protein